MRAGKGEWASSCPTELGLTAFCRSGNCRFCLAVPPSNAKLDQRFFQRWWFYIFLRPRPSRNTLGQPPRSLWESAAMSASEILRRLYLIGATSPDTSRLLYGLIRHDEEENYLSNLQDSDLARLVDYLDGVRTLRSAFRPITKRNLQVLSTIPISDDLYPQCLRKLQAICGHHMTLPSSYTMSGDFSRIGDSPVASGGVADIWEGAHHGRKVCIKRLKVPLDDGRTLTKVRVLHRHIFFVSNEERLWAP